MVRIAAPADVQKPRLAKFRRSLLDVHDGHVDVVTPSGELVVEITGVPGKLESVSRIPGTIRSNPWRRLNKGEGQHEHSFEGGDGPLVFIDNSL